MGLTENLDSVIKRISRACETSGRETGSVTLIAVTKTVRIERIREAYDLGIRDFGENRLQEALPKIEALPKDIRWHFVGKLQSNKARKAAEAFFALHSLESKAQLRELEKSSRKVDGLIEINIAEAPQKFGIFPQRLDEFLVELTECKQVRFRGLMAIGPNLGDPEAMRPYFKRLRRLNSQAGGQWLSMGMSADFDVAIQEGATHIRVGTALFGAR